MSQYMLGSSNIALQSIISTSGSQTFYNATDLPILDCPICPCVLFLSCVSWILTFVALRESLCEGPITQRAMLAALGRVTQDLRVWAKQVTPKNLLPCWGWSQTTDGTRKKCLLGDGCTWSIVQNDAAFENNYSTSRLTLKYWLI